jgi:hypothetical protein
MKVTNSGANCATDALFFATQILHARRAEECLEYRPAGSIDRWRALHAVRGNRSSLGTARGQFHFRYIYVPLNPIPRRDNAASKIRLSGPACRSAFTRPFRDLLAQLRKLTIRLRDRREGSR